MTLIILTVIMGGIIGIDKIRANSPKEMKKIAEAERIGRERANARIEQIRKEAKERAEYWASTGLPFNKWK